jgi:hypothetical protein
VTFLETLEVGPLPETWGIEDELRFWREYSGGAIYRIDELSAVD